MENIIKKSVEGGFEHDDVSDEAVVCDPFFWQALGKACGWNIKEDYTIEFGMVNEPIAQAIRFHSINLVDGWSDAVSWLESLIKS